MSSVPSIALKGIWLRHNIQPRIKHFLWRAVPDALPTNVRRSRVLPCIEKTCPVCGDDEAMFHVLLNCSFARAVWFGLGLSLNLSEAMDFKGVLDLWTRPEVGEDYFHKATITSWIIRKARCERIFSRVRPSTTSTITRVHAFIAALASNDPEKLPEMRTQILSQSSWTTPDHPMIKINVDARVGENESTLATLARDSSGQLLSV